MDVYITIKQEALRATIAHLSTMNATKISRQNGTKKITHVSRSLL